MKTNCPTNLTAASIHFNETFKLLVLFDQQSKTSKIFSLMSHNRRSNEQGAVWGAQALIKSILGELKGEGQHMHEEKGKGKWRADRADDSDETH